MSPRDFNDIDLTAFEATLPADNGGFNLASIMHDFVATPALPIQASIGMLASDNSWVDWRLLGSPLSSSIWTNLDRPDLRQGNPVTLKACEYLFDNLLYI